MLTYISGCILKSSETIASFCKKLKMHLFNLLFHPKSSAVPHPDNDFDIMLNRNVTHREVYYHYNVRMSHIEKFIINTV